MLPDFHMLIVNQASIRIEFRTKDTLKAIKRKLRTPPNKDGEVCLHLRESE